jgi:hypothetical protein
VESGAKAIIRVILSEVEGSLTISAFYIPALGAKWTLGSQIIL